MKPAAIVSAAAFRRFRRASFLPSLGLIALIFLLCALPLGATSYSWGAFRVETKPSGAIVRALGTFEYFGESPTEPFAFTMDRYMGFNGFVAGRWFNLEISKPGYQTQYSLIFVPFTEKHEEYALKRPQVYMFTLPYLPVYYPPVFVPPVCPPPPYYYYPAQPNNPYHKSSVEISSSPAGAAVYIDGTYYGQTPLKITLNWILGVNEDKTVVFEKSGFQSQQKLLAPFQKQVHAVLQPRSQRRY